MDDPKVVLGKYRKQRSSIKARVTIFKNYLADIENNLSKPDYVFPIQDFESRLSRARPLLDNYEEIQYEIDMLVDDLTDEMLYREQFENDYFSSVCKADTILSKQKLNPSENSVADSAENQSNDDSRSNNGSRSSVSNYSQNNQMSSNIKLPTIQLPKFSGNYQNWLEFHDTFQSIIVQNPEISLIQKFHYLKCSVTDAAERVIHSLPVSADNFIVAWQMLCERFANQELLIYNHTKSIFNIQKITKQSSFSIRQLIDTLQSNLRSLKSLKQPVDQWDTLLIFIIVERLDPDTAHEWESTKPSEASLEVILNFLRNKADILEKIEANRSQGINRERKLNKNSTRSLVSSQISCLLCKSPKHKLNNCNEFLSIPVPERSAQIKRLKLCFNCLHPGHNQVNCKYGKCSKCGKKHHTLLHIDYSSSESQNTSADSDQSNSQVTQTLSSSISCNELILLSTAIIHVLDKKGVAHKCRVLLDSGSQSNFISDKLVNKLGLPKEKINISVYGIAETSSIVNYKCNVSVRSIHSSFSTLLSCLITRTICDQLPGFQIDPLSVSIPPNIQLSDQQFHASSDIDLLIGASLFYDLLCVGQIKLGPQGPILQKTKFGWIISGPFHNKNSPRKTFCNFSHYSNSQVVDELSRFWEIEEFPNYPLHSEEEIKCEQHFKDTHKRDSQGRFIVSIPFKDSVEKLGDSKMNAERRFYCVERRLLKDPILKDKYNAFMDEYVQLGHMSKMGDSDIPNAHFLPHHGVLKEDSLTTKLRVVFDGSAPTTSGTSFNDIQMVGPVVQSDLISIVLRFRQHSYVVSADIEKMYRQVLISTSQRHLQQILWRSEAFQPLTSYSLNTVTYGTAAASFLATRCLTQLAEEYSEKFPKASSIIARDFYVDDLLTGSDSIPELIAHCQQIIQILSSGCFPLRKWISNESSILEAVQQSFSSETQYSFGPSDNTKTLGLHWQPQSDFLTFTIPSETIPKTVTKRSVLAGIARVFDPLGLLSPAIIKAKILMQQLWLEKLGWDQSVPLHIHTDWLTFRDQLSQLNNLQIPRRVKLNGADIVEMHGFCDASELAYGACIYVRSISGTEIRSHLLCAKSKVAPLKRVTIPRLELCAALILSRLSSRVLDSLTLKFDNVFFWSDSTVVLSWLKTSPHLLKTFVANRVSEIQSSTSVPNWNYVNTRENPADLISRGTSPSNLRSCIFWWHGPDFLNQPREYWPAPLLTSTSDVPELKQPRLTSLISTNEFKFPFERFSSLYRLKRICALCIRFGKNCLSRVKGVAGNFGPLSNQELHSALLTLLRLSQAESFSSELNNLQNAIPISSKSKVLSLNPFLDDCGLIRVGGRLRNSLYDYEKKHPIIISPRHHLSKLIFNSEHIRLFHAGPQQLLYSIRESYWPILGRNLAKETVHKCVICFRARPLSKNPLMGDLPSHRFTPFLPFINTGVDYAGPFKLRDRNGRGFKVYKAYISLFICLSTKAVHLELVTDLTSDAFLAALKRFAARRGKPRNLYSDNGSNFIGSNNRLRELGKFLLGNTDQLVNSGACQDISWHFIPAYSPHFGGIWEAGVKSMKFHLKRVLSEALLTYEDFCTILVQVEAILNSRPLTPLTSDPADLASLTPSHFLIGRSLSSIPEQNFGGVKMNRLSHYNRLQQLRQHLWKRWSTEYVSELQTRQKWRQNYSKLKVDDLVLIKHIGSNPLQWMLGRVTKLHHGHDGIARVATLRTSGGEIQRAVSNLCPLPLTEGAYSNVSE